MSITLDNTSRAANHLELTRLGVALESLDDKLGLHTAQLTALGLQVGNLVTGVDGVATAATGLGSRVDGVATAATGLGTHVDGVTAQLTQGLTALRTALELLKTAIEAQEQTLPDWMANTLQAISNHLGAMQSLFTTTHEASEAIRGQAEAALIANQEQVAIYLQNVNEPLVEPDEPDPYPFLELPAGFAVRYLPDGGRLFTLSTGDQLRVSTDGALAFIGADGQAQALEAGGGNVVLPDGMVLPLNPQALRSTLETALVSIAGLTEDIEAEQVAAGRYRLVLGASVLHVDHSARTATLTQYSGEWLLLSYPRTQAFGEDCQTGILPGGLKHFATVKTGTRGIIQLDGTIELATAEGLDIVIRFPEPAPSVNMQETRPICEGECRGGCA